MMLLRIAAGVALLGVSAFAQTSYQDIRRADPSTWLTYSGNYQGQRYSPLSQINRQNVAQLRPVWVYQTNPGVVETTPIVVNGVMYITEPPSTVTALDPRTGRPLWRYSPAIPSDVIAIGSPPVNRGVAILDNTVFSGTLHGHLVALDAKSGLVRWDVIVDDNKFGYYVTTAPLAIDGKIIIGVSGAEAGIRGFIDAYDPKTGKRLWRRWAIPAPGEPGSETWPKNNSWRTGGGSTWLTGSYDPDLNLLYWGIGNPAPDFNADDRAGDNLFTCALLALNPADGTIKWHFQFTPRDVHDWDANQIPVLFDASINGRDRKVVAMANRNGFYYVLDRQTGEFLVGTPFVKQTWADGLDAKGRPRVRPGSEPSIEGSLVYPDARGAANWWSPSYSPQTKLFYQAAREAGSVFFKGEYEYKPGTVFAGGGQRELEADEAYGVIRALEATTGKLKWEFKLLTTPRGGVMATAGGLLFGGAEEGNFFALDAENGQPLWEFQLGGGIRTNPIAFAIDGTEYVAISGGSALFVFGLK
jgi:alcohol dehydrogenase (cytochrome c)